MHLELLLSIHHPRVVNSDNTVRFQKIFFQLPKSPDRAHYVRCDVILHEFPDGGIGVSYQAKLLGRFSKDGKIKIETEGRKKKRVA